MHQTYTERWGSTGCGKRAVSGVVPVLDIARAEEAAEKVGF
jgi:hypothetical protein